MWPCVGSQPTPENRTLKLRSCKYHEASDSISENILGMKGRCYKKCILLNSQNLPHSEKKKERDINDVTCSLEYEHSTVSSTETHSAVRHMTDKFICNTTLWKPKFHCKLDRESSGRYIAKQKDTTDIHPPPRKQRKTDVVSDGVLPPVPISILCSANQVLHFHSHCGSQ